MTERDSARLDVEVYRDLGDPRLQATWLDMERSAVRIDPFSTFWWTRAGQAGDRSAQPYIVLVHDPDGASALASFALARRNGKMVLTQHARRLRDLFDMLAVTCTPDVAETLCQALPWEETDQIRLDGIPDDSPLGPALLNAAKERGFKGVMYVNDGAPELSLLDEQGRHYPDYRSIMKSKKSRRLRRKMTQMGDVRYLRAETREHIEELLSSLFWLHQKRWVGTPWPSHCSSPAMQKLYLRIAQGAFDAGSLHLAMLYVDKQPVSGALGYIVGRKYYGHNSPHDPDYRDYSPGWTFRTFLLDDLLASREVDVLNYLAGLEPYNLVHTSQVIGLHCFRMVRSRPRAIPVKAAAVADSWLRGHPWALAIARKIKHFLQWRKYGLACRIKRLRGYYRNLGATGFATRAARKAADLFYEKRRSFIMHACLQCEIEATPGLTIRAGTLDDCNQLTVKRYGFLDPVTIGAFFQRLRKGMQYYVAYLDDEPVSSVWIMIGCKYTPLYGEWEVTSDPALNRDAFVLNAWTDPRVRGRRLYPQLVRGVMRRLQAAGVLQRILVAVDVKNEPALRAHEHAGFAPTEELEIVRLLGRTIAKHVRPLHSTE